jgi:hypothetical protein
MKIKGKDGCVLSGTKENIWDENKIEIKKRLLIDCYLNTPSQSRSGRKEKWSKREKGEQNMDVCRRGQIQMKSVIQ